ncbi:uncharacterized protein LOC62_07G009206 [Vanrija pseudolonga]|uniref:Uncharacterized protein n=1 Tax=Vanrija pseudolonga TaxID=143232 RepID=A0AAF0YJM7_9TREE|nr:hypothetical protein LOC62_07G009206 [Vanrija pseudolonga]
MLGVASFAGGIAGFTFARSVPSLLGGLGIGCLMFGAGMRIRDNMKGGEELAAASSAALAVPMFRRAVKTRGIVPIAMALASVGSAGFYSFLAAEHYQEASARKAAVSR